LHDLPRDCVPLPHVTSQSDHETHPDQTPSTKIILLHTLFLELQ